MKKLIWIATFSMALNAWAQTEATPAPQDASATPAPVADGAAATTESTATTPKKAAAKPAAATSTTQAKPPAPPKSPWGGMLILDVSRATDINHSKILDPDNPDQRTDYDALVIGTLKYTASKKNSFNATEAVGKSFIRNAATPSANDAVVKNLRLGWTRSTDYSLLGSGKIALPFSVSLPTAYDSRASGTLASFRFKPSIGWEFNPTWSLTWTSQTDATFKNPVDQPYTDGYIVENGTLVLNNSMALGAALSDTASLSQSLGMTSSSKNFKNILGMDQVGSSLDLNTTLEFVMGGGKFILDMAVNQSAPMQGNGNGATKVYDNNTFRLYHVAQTSYEVTGIYMF